MITSYYIHALLNCVTFHRDSLDATEQVATGLPPTRRDLPNISEQVATSFKLICRTQLYLFTFKDLHSY